MPATSSVTQQTSPTTLLSSSSEHDDNLRHHHVVIVGAGITGLAASRKLVAEWPSVHVTLVERDTRVGGRIHTVPFPAPPSMVECGAGRINTSKHHRTMAMLKALRIPLRPNGTTRSFVGVGAKWEATGVPTLQEIRSTRDRLREAYRDGGGDRGGLGARAFEAWARGVVGADTYHRMVLFVGYDGKWELMAVDDALRALDEELDDDFGHVPGGLSRLTETLHREAEAHPRVRVLLGHEVVRHRRDGALREVHVRQTTPGDGTPATMTLRCACIVMTNPVQTNKLYPGGERARRRIHRLIGSKPLVRVYAKLSSPLPVAGRITTDGALRYIIPIRPDAGLYMISYTDGDKRVDSSARLCRGRVGRELVRMFGRAGAPRVEGPRLLRCRWALGTSFWAPGPARADLASTRERVMLPAPDVIQIGESVATYPSWVEGALQTVDIDLPRLIRGAIGGRGAS